MADQQPSEDQPAAGMPEPSPPDSSPPEPSPPEPPTVDAPVRWSGSAAVPDPAPRKSRWTRRKPGENAADADPDNWAAIPAVDPWADQVTPWDGFPFITDPATSMPPTLAEPPLPPTRIEPPPSAAPPAAAPIPAGPTPAGPPIPAGPPVPPPPSGKAKKRGRKDNGPVNRHPVQPRPSAGPGGPALPAPPPWTPRPVQRPLPAPPRRKRRWGRRLALLSLFGVFCCCGLPFAYFQFPAARQYPVSAELPSSFGDLQLRDDGGSKQAAERLADQLRTVNASADDVFAGVYTDNRGKRVTVFGVTGWRFTPGKDVEAQVDRMAGEFDLTGVQTFDVGVTGVHERCGAGRVDSTAVVICAWADHGSLATVLLTRRSVSDSADLVTQLREEVLTPG